MKKLMLFLMGFMLLTGGMAFADEESLISIPNGFEIKQGFIIPWEDSNSGFMNMSTVTFVRTDAYEPFKKWNAVWEGWSLDGAWSYDAGTSSFGLMLGKDFGNLSKYLPVSFPMADKINITVYPVGIVVNHPFDDPETSGASGAAIVKMTVSF